MPASRAVHASCSRGTHIPAHVTPVFVMGSPFLAFVAFGAGNTRLFLAFVKFGTGEGLLVYATHQS